MDPRGDKLLAHREEVAALTDVDAELEQLTVDPWCTPTGILSAHLAEQISDASDAESQFPTATFALESFFGFRLGCCASAMWTLHRAHLSQKAGRS
jgi:hypothetical protein